MRSGNQVTKSENSSLKTESAFNVKFLFKFLICYLNLVTYRVSFLFKKCHQAAYQAAKKFHWKRKRDREMYKGCRKCLYECFSDFGLSGVASLVSSKLGILGFFPIWVRNRL